MSKKYKNTENLSILEDLYNFVNNEAIPETGLLRKNFERTIA